MIASMTAPILTRLTLAASLVQLPAAAQGIISTAAGGNLFRDNVPAAQARLDNPQSVAVDANGNTYVGELDRIRRIDAVTGLISTVAGGGEQFLSEGPALNVRLTGPTHLNFDPRGNLLFIESRRILKLDLQTRTVTNFAGAPGSTTPQLGSISALAIDRSGNIFAADDYYGKIYRINGATAAVETFAGTAAGGGNPGPPAGEDGPATNAFLLRPSLVTVDPAGNVYFVEQYWLRRIDAKTNIVTSIMPFTSARHTSGGTGDGGPVSKAALGNAYFIRTDSNGDLYIADGPLLRKITWSTGIIAAVAGSTTSKSIDDGIPATQAALGQVYSFDIAPSGNIWITDLVRNRLFHVDAASGRIRTLAGNSPNGDGGPALGALLIPPSAIALNAAGDIFLSSGGIRRVDHASGRISTISPPQDTETGTLAVDPLGTIYYYSQRQLKRLDPASGESVTITNSVNSPVTIALEPSGTLLLADSFSYSIRRLDPKSGIFQTIVGNGSPQPYSGEPGPATQVPIGVPGGVAVSPSGQIYWTTASRVLKLNPDSTISAAAGIGGCNYSGDGGPATLAGLCSPYFLAFDAAGNLFVTDSYCSCVRRVSAATGIIQTVAGTGQTGQSADGIPAASADLDAGPIAHLGNTLYVIDRPGSGSANSRVRTVTPSTPPSLPQPPRLTGITSAVDFRPYFSPGALVSVFGNYLGPAEPASGQLAADGRVATSLAGNTLTFQGLPAPILYASASQINAVIPYGVTPGRRSVQLTTPAGTDTSGAINVTPTSPSLFPGLVYNPDGTLNSKSNPAPKGATLVLYGTGMGLTNPSGVDGAIVRPPDLPQPVARATAYVSATGQFPAEVLYFGPLPGFVAGAVQANIRIPDAVPPGEATLHISSAGQSSQGQPIHMLSDPPVLTAVSPAPPIPQSVGRSIPLVLTGRNLSRISKVNLFFNGSPFQPSGELFLSCPTTTTCSVNLNLLGRAGLYAIELVNVANQVSNRLPFDVAPYSPSVITSVIPSSGSGSLVARAGLQQLTIVGDNFREPLTIDVFLADTRIATLSTANRSQISNSRSDAIFFYFDFQGRPGLYGFEVAAEGIGRSARFSLTVP
jgi:uncharacterized protein (TIGR03437 family)